MFLAEKFFPLHLSKIVSNKELYESNLLQKTVFVQKKKIKKIVTENSLIT